jgi:hypothetical protein
MQMRCWVLLCRNRLSKRDANHSKTALTVLGLEHPSSGALLALCTTEPARLTTSRKWWTIYHMSPGTYLHIPTDTCIYVHIHAYTYIYMHIHAHTCSTWEHQNTQNMLLISARAGASCTMQSVGRMTQVWACLDDPGRFYDRGNMEPNTKSLVRGRFWRLLQP